MTKRVTIMHYDDLARKLYEIQTKLIRESTESVSFSAVINETLCKNTK